MRIGLSTSVIQRGRTGIAQYVFALVRALAEAGGGHQFVLFVLEEDLPLFQFASSSMEIVVVPEKFRPAVKNIFWHQFHLPKLVREHRIDVLHIPSYRRLLWPRPCALVATIHDLAPFQVSGKYDWRRMFYGRVVARRLARRQDEIIAISRNTSADIMKFFGLSPERVRVIYNGLDHDRFFQGNQERAKAKAARIHGLSQPFFLYVARLEHPGKNHVRLIDAFNRFKTVTKSNWQLVLAGSDWHGAPDIHQTIAASPFAQEIRCLGFVADAELPELYQAADALVFPSLYEGFGLPVVEAMACGCPVLSSTRGSLGEVVDGAAEIIEPEDIENMAGQMGRLAEDAGLREKLRRLGLERAKQFDWKITAAATLAAYAEAFRAGKTDSKQSANRIRSSTIPI